jgi:molybdenum cofactor cytidylyltransferase
MQTASSVPVPARGEPRPPDVVSDRVALPAAGMIAGVILAAGTSSRLGRPKQLLPLRGATVLQHIVDVAGASGLDDVVVVLGHEAATVEASLRLPEQTRVSINLGYQTGQASSLRVGLRALGQETLAAVVMLGDQPDVAGQAIQSVLAAYDRTGGLVVQASYCGHLGHPVLLDRRIWPEVEAVRGDAGARDLLAAHPKWIVAAEVPADPPPDLDTWEDYRQMSGELEQERRAP